MSKEIQFVLTNDGSPTAFFNTEGADNFMNEKMHHAQGAFQETIYVYGPAIQWGFAQMEKPKILSLGTGLAYNEIISVAFSILFDSELQMVSYEKNQDLNDSLIAWLKAHPTESLVPADIYDLILQKTAELFEISESDIKGKMISLYQSGDWKIKGAWDSSDKTQYNVILFDFFSGKAMEAFWTQNFLDETIRDNSAENCAFATYACTGNLRRALLTSDYKYFKRPGYAWKKNSTFAYKSKSKRN
jgi:hypothetical protein